MCLRTSKNSYTIGTGFGRIVAISVGLPFGQVSEHPVTLMYARHSCKFSRSTPPLPLPSLPPPCPPTQWDYLYILMELSVSDLAFFLAHRENSKSEGEKKRKEKKRVSEHLEVANGEQWPPFLLLHAIAREVVEILRHGGFDWPAHSGSKSKK